jgi:acyl carrier protein
MPTTESEVFQKVQTVLVEALGVDEEEVNSEAKLKADLGAESIDFLDISFQLEKAFAIKIEQKEFAQNAQSEADDADLTVDSVVKFVMTKVA